MLSACRAETAAPISETASSTISFENIASDVEHPPLAISGTEAGQALADLYLQNKSNDTVIAYVNKEPIYQRDFLVAKKTAEITSAYALSQISDMDNSEDRARLEAQFAMPDDNTILQKLIKNAVMVQEAERRHITVSDDEACAYGEKTYKEMQEAAAANSQNQTDLDLINAYMTALNLSPEEYFQTVAKDGYKSYLMKEKLYESVYAAFTEEQKASETAYEDYINQLINQAEVVFENAQ